MSRTESKSQSALCRMIEPDVPRVLRFALLILVAGWISAQGTNSALDQGIAKFQRNDFTGAVQAFLKVTQQQPSNTRALTYLGMAYAVQEDYKSAQHPLRRACDLHSAEENACYFLGR